MIYLFFEWQEQAGGWTPTIAKLKLVIYKASAVFYNYDTNRFEDVGCRCQAQSARPESCWGC